MEEYQDLCMRLYWDCEELINKLGELTEGDNRKEVIVSWLEKIDNKYPRLPEFKSEYHWINVAQPIRMENLNGLVTLLDFFTYCCINCMHILPDLEKLEEKYEGSKLTVVGIHSAKFENEKVGDHLSDAVARYDIRHPVCNDTNAWLWSTLGVTCWPTQLILGPTGRPVWVSMGEGQAGRVEEMVGVMLEYYGARGQLTGDRIVGQVSARVEGRMLSYPGKVTVSGDLVVVSDTGNNRIVMTDRQGAVLDIVGGVEAGQVDGGFSEARFRHPQGVLRLEDKVYVCDTDNNVLRCIHLDTRTVTTLGGAPGLSSPWDLCHLNLEDDRGQMLVVAMAGCHQIWLYCLTQVTWWKGAKYPAGSLVSVVGSGKEENRNNSYPHKAGLAQPSGLCTDGQAWIYFADSESSSVRRISLKDGAVTNVAGGDRDPLNLFSYGDIDGDGVGAKLQHPLGVSLDTSSNILYIADSYNHKIKKAELKGKLWNVTSTAGGLSEPGGICLEQSSNTIYIADTNNHAIKLLNLDTNNISTLNITNNTDTVDSPEKNDAAASDISEHVISSEKGNITITATVLKSGYKLNTEAKSSWRLTCDEAGDDWTHETSGQVTGDTLTVSMSHGPLTPGGQLKLHLTCKLFLCSDQGVCIMKNVQKIVILKVVKEEAETILKIGSMF